ncbi:MAG: DUF3021 domain-containing protein [Clostridia bacterium]|nr:DUF3021 domain-containing protein [Clostridia bacterium]
MKKKLLFRSVLGAPLGVTVSLIITVIFSLCMGSGEYFPAPQELISLCGNEITAVIVQAVCSLFVGAVCGGSSVIWEAEKWSLLKQTLVHFAVLAVPFFGIGYVMSWVPHNLYGALGYAGAFVAVYLITWISIYFSVKAKIKKLNKQLSELQQADANKN